MPIPITRVKNKEQAKQYLDGMKNIKNKVLDSKVSQKVMIPVGNAVIKAASAPFKWAGKQIEKDIRGGEQKWKNLQRKNEMERTGQYEGPSINTTSKKNKMGEIINPTKSDVSKYNAKYQTIKMKK